MAPEFRKAQMPEIEDPITRRFASAVVPAARDEWNTNYAVFKFHSVGNLLVAAVHRYPPNLPVFSVFARKKSDQGEDLISGIQFALPDPDSVGHDAPQRWIVASDKPFKKWIGDEYVSLRLDEGIAFFTEQVTGRGDSIIRGDPEDIIDLLDPFGKRIEDPDEADRIRERIAFSQDLDRQGYSDAEPHEVEKVAEGLEIVVFQGRWRRKKREARAEELFRDALSLNE